MIPIAKTCTLCGESKPLKAFAISGRGRIRSRCKPCEAQTYRERYAHHNRKESYVYRDVVMLAFLSSTWDRQGLGWL